jgi:hypothetical protein
MTDTVTQISTNLNEHPEYVTYRIVFSIVTNVYSNLASKPDFIDKATTVQYFCYFLLDYISVILCRRYTYDTTELILMSNHA